MAYRKQMLDKFEELQPEDRYLATTIPLLNKDKFSGKVRRLDTPIAVMRNIKEEVHARIHNIHDTGMWKQHSIKAGEIVVKFGTDAGDELFFCR